LGIEASTEFQRVSAVAPKPFQQRTDQCRRGFVSSKVYYAPITTKLRSAAKRRDVPLAEVAQRDSSHRNGDLCGYYGWVEWIVLGIAEHQLERVLAGWQFNTCLSLPSPEV
jgi:hypothetical protein